MTGHAGAGGGGGGGGGGGWAWGWGWGRGVNAPKAKKLMLPIRASLEGFRALASGG